MTTQLLLTPEGAAHTLSLSRTQVYALMKSGQIESLKIGRARRIPRAALVRYVAQIRGSNRAA